ncbi:MAG: glycerophosphodiester phosphodiesterase [Fusobacteriaceae bacterium]|nr:glycerophosphodiester phosphodiesterase [Fusobacteriaceae bacterium]
MENKILNIAHRGFSGLYPENTLIAFKNAIEAGCDGIETDLHLTKDGIIVLCHDETIDKTTNGSGFIREYSYSDLIKFDAGIKFNMKFKGEIIPTLEDLLIIVNDKNIILNLELKNDIIHYEGLEEKTLELIDKYKMIDKVIISSFNHDSMKKIRQLNTKIKIGLLVDKNLEISTEDIKKILPNSINPNYKSLYNLSSYEKIKNKNLEIFPYTINEVSDLIKMINLNVTGIITNFPNLLNDLLK